MLAPFEKITRRISGANYPTFSMIHPYIEILKRSFAPRSDQGETKQLYLDLVYGCTFDDDGSTDSSISDDNSIPSGGTRQHWQYAHRQFRQHMKKGKGKKRIEVKKKYQLKRKKSQTNNLDANTIECLPSVNPEGLLQKVRAAIFLSLDELWTIPSDLALLASILDPRFKTFQWAPDQLGYAKMLLERSYTEMKIALDLLDLNNFPGESASSSKINNDDDDFFGQLKTTPRQALELIELDEVTRYLAMTSIGLNEDPLEWWHSHKTGLPILTQLAKKYLSIPASSVPSERLFSDAGNLITSKRTRLAPDIVNKFLFLKRNSKYIEIFAPQ